MLLMTFKAFFETQLTILALAKTQTLRLPIMPQVRYAIAV